MGHSESRMAAAQARSALSDRALDVRDQARWPRVQDPRGQPRWVVRFRGHARVCGRRGYRVAWLLWVRMGGRPTRVDRVRSVEAELPIELGHNVLRSLESMQITLWTAWRRYYIFSGYSPYSIGTHGRVKNPHGYTQSLEPSQSFYDPGDYSMNRL